MAKRRRKKKRFGYIVVVTALALTITGFLFYLAQNRFSETRIHYPAFGIRIPKQYVIHGIDVSRYQGRISWPLVKSMHVDHIRIGFAFIKATEADFLTDPLFSRNWKQSRDAGMIRGAYHYYRPRIDAAAQARFFIRKVKLKSGDLPPVLDVEELNGVSPQSLRNGVQVWLKMAEDHYGVKPVIYSGSSFYAQYLKGHFDQYPVWIAHYNTNKPRLERKFHFWQHSETGRVDGIKGPVDFNVFNGDSTAFVQMLLP